MALGPSGDRAAPRTAHDKDCEGGCLPGREAGGLCTTRNSNTRGSENRPSPGPGPAGRRGPSFLI